jgi:hypothetical protein
MPIFQHVSSSSWLGFANEDVKVVHSNAQPILEQTNDDVAYRTINMEVF